MPAAPAEPRDAGAVVRRAIQRHHLVHAQDKVVVGFSGGADSLALLHILNELRQELDISVVAAHLNHRLRGEDSDADADFAAETSRAWGLECVVASTDVGAEAQARGLAIEETARQVRYAFLARVAMAQGARVVAVAHNADDQVETVLMHFLRGSGLAGLRGMEPAVPLRGLRLGGAVALPGELMLVRPLLDVPRSDIERYLGERGLTPRFDRSNLDTTYCRNRLRQQLIPCLEGYNPNVRQVVRRTSAVLAAEYDFLARQTDVAWERVARRIDGGMVLLDLSAFREQHLSLRRSLVRRAIECLRPSLRNIDFVHVEQVVETVDTAKGAGARVTLPDGLEVEVGYDGLVVCEAGGQGAPAGDWPQLPSGVEAMPLTLPVDVPLADGWRLAAWVADRESLSATFDDGRHPWVAYLDATVAGSGLVLRQRLAGERLQPLGLGGHSKKLNELMINLKVPAAARQRYPVLANGEHLLWLPGFHIDHRARVGGETRRVLIAEVKRE